MTADFPAESAPWLYLARALTHLGNTVDARDAYLQVLMRWPNQKEALNAIR